MLILLRSGAHAVLVEEKPGGARPPRSIMPDTPRLPPPGRDLPQTTPKPKAKAKAKEDHVKKLQAQIAEELNAVRSLLQEVPDDASSAVVKTAMRVTVETLAAKSSITTNMQASNPICNKAAAGRTCVLPHLHGASFPGAEGSFGPHS